MRWVWSDEIVETLTAAGAPEAMVRRFREVPVAVAVPEGSDPVAYVVERLRTEPEHRDLAPGSQATDLLDSSL